MTMFFRQHQFQVIFKLVSEPHSHRLESILIFMAKDKPGHVLLAAIVARIAKSGLSSSKRWKHKDWFCKSFNSQAKNNGCRFSSDGLHLKGGDWSLATVVYSCLLANISHKLRFIDFILLWIILELLLLSFEEE